MPTPLAGVRTLRAADRVGMLGAEASAGSQDPHAHAGACPTPEAGLTAWAWHLMGMPASNRCLPFTPETVNYDEARHTLLMHGSGVYNDAGEPMALDDGFLGMLRPYRGLRENNFHVVMQALLVVGQRIHQADSVDRPLVESLWSTCSLMRAWGLHPSGMLRRNKLITEADARRLETWIDIFERSALGLLGGCPPHYEVERYAQYVIDSGPGENIAFFIPLMQQLLDDPDASDPTVVAEALGKLGPVARGALRSLHDANARTYPHYCDADAHDAITRAIALIEANG
ncbi:MAG TPA: hypothetical protein VF796_08655 [Humisphaera sp.]